ncbi:Pentraxin fusion protein [Dissostichus eleginoides]|uniref:Pentraxin fusion protein n=1 Tax=Dissostichus eleginoides TaxID=100907 RepID=A0AAD9EUH6_DISEL|nr:Pentraxin fusion protein [Dissostichus eleginoides]
MFKAPKLGPTETHMCVTWDSSSGAAAIFMDGRKSVTKMYRRGHRIRSEGKVIIGQDPDNYLGNSTIQDMNSGKRVPRGNVFDWESIELKVKGGAEVVNSEH